MRTKYYVWRHHKLIFTGTMPQVKRFLISTGEFSYYEKQVMKCKYANSKAYGTKRYTLSLNHWCAMTEYCTTRPVDRRGENETTLKAISEFQYEVLNSLVEKQKENFKQVGM